MASSGPPRLRVFLSTTDHSGDQHAAALIESIRRRRPDAEFAGMGGPRMAEAGCHLLVDATEHSVMWFSALFDLPRWLGRLRQIGRFWAAWRPDVFVPIDSPGINFPLARRARAQGIASVYYIPPQIWAWGRWRLPKLKRLFARLLVALPFEEAFYRRRGFDVRYVGHPIFDYLPRTALGGDLRAELGLRPTEVLVGLLPGSRRQEVRRIMPILCGAAQRLARERPEVRFAVGAAGEGLVPDIQAPLTRSGLHAPVLRNRTLELMRDARLCLVASGTATLQLLHFLTPLVVVYRLNWAEWGIMKLFRRSRYIGLVNILADQEVAPELVLWRDCPARIAASALPLLDDSPRRAEMVGALQALRAKVGRPGAVDCAAEAVIEAAGAGFPVPRGPGLGLPPARPRP